MASEKQVVVSFRVDSHLAEMLNRLPDKSEFIREAILTRFHDACPLCQGRGVLPEILARWWADRIAHGKSKVCRCCGYRYPAELVGRQDRTKRPGQYLCPHCSEQRHAH